MENEKIYRPNVAALILPAQYPARREIFIGERNDISGVWQFPQGGIDEGETPVDALLRELEEEIGTRHVEIVAEHPEWLSYDFPEHIARRMQPYSGQIQRYFLVRLLPDAVINLETKHPEFVRYRFVSLDELFQCTAHFKKPIYEKVIAHFTEEGYL